MEEDEAPVAPRDRLEALLQCRDLPGRLRVDLAEQRLAEVGDLRAREAADEALRPGDADLDPSELEHEVIALEDHHAGRAQSRGHVVRPTGVMIVVAEHRHDRERRDDPAGVGEHRCLLGHPVGGQIAGEQHEVGLLGELGERLRDALAMLLGGMEVARRRDTDHRDHDRCLPGCPGPEPRAARPLAAPRTARGLRGRSRPAYAACFARSLLTRVEIFSTSRSAFFSSARFASRSSTASSSPIAFAIRRRPS